MPDTFTQPGPHLEPGPSCPRCGHPAFIALHHDPTGQLEGHECLSCELETDEHGQEATA
ncbi:hypothetical protein [Deinococcus aquaticus]|uniref:DNA-binding protein n=1 Tax=Deinococcus aquaticus TaxID=328692 RepID=A0ABY7V6L1_9DEIO|nr:hypothetical protein [Deinococcus aquaticus]WDA60705.1 hypothetical protein M8445_17205 [Deinococcus aquaticus]